MKHKPFDETFQRDLVHLIEKAESLSNTEWVVTIVPESDKYLASKLLSGISVAGLALTVLLFIPIELHEEYIFLMSILSFGLGYVLCSLLPALKRLFVSRKKREKIVELHARATFQASHLHLTQDHIAVLWYYSLLEKTVYIVADKGVIDKIPTPEWEKVQAQAQNVFTVSNKQKSEQILSNLKQAILVFEKHLPITETSSINEISNNITIL